MKTLYVHIGTAKTGTTSIQNFCIDNQKVLNQKGYYYPRFPYRYENVSPRRNGHFLLDDEIKDKQGRFREAMDCIRGAFENYDNIILSEETIWSISKKARMEIFKALKEESIEGGFQVKIIVYFRRQDEYMSSSWSQDVKGGASGGSTWEEYVKSRKSLHKLKYGTGLKLLMKFWGKENVIVRRFDFKRFVGGSIYADFLDAVGLELTDEYEIAQFFQNTKLAGNTHEIMRIVNGMPDIDEEQRFFFRRVLESFADLSGKEYPNAMFSKEEAEAFLKQYEDENRRVSEAYFNGEELFDTGAVKDLPKWQKDNPHMLDDTVRFICACYVRLMKENAKLRLEIDKLNGNDKLKHSVLTVGKKALKKVKGK